MPLTLTICGLLGALSAKVKVALRSANPEGVRVRLTVQSLLGGTVAPVHVSTVLAKSPTLAPARVTVEMLRFTMPELVTVSVMASLNAFKSCGPKLKLGAERLTAGSAPVPVKVTV